MWSVIVLDLELQQVYFAAENVNQWDALEIINGLTEKDCLIAAILRTLRLTLGPHFFVSDG